MFLRNQHIYARGGSNQGRSAATPVVINNNHIAVGRIKQQFGQLHPSQLDRRQQAHRAHTNDTWETRAPQINPLIEPLPRRHQVAMTYRLAPHFQQQLSAGRLNTGNQGRIRKSFRDIDPVYVSPRMPVTNAVTGRRAAHALPPLL